MSIKIYTYDTTLRDGGQTEGISLTLEDKLAIVRRLDEFGIDVIEGGFPASNPKDIAFFQQVQSMELRHAKIAAFGNTCKKGVAASEDSGLADLLASGASIVTIVGKSWDAQVERALVTSLDENLRMVSESVAYLKSQGVAVVFDAEHFFDGYKSNPDYALAVVKAAHEAGADSIDLCETNGGALPFEVEEIVKAVVKRFPDQRFGIHCHNDSGCAVANTLAAVRGGCVQVQGTINGYGERVGNVDLLTVIADLQLKMGYECVPDLTQLTSVAQFVSDVTNIALPRHYPYVGASAFTHKGGLHASAIARFREAYEHEDPASVGNSTRVLVSEFAGKASLITKAKSLGIDLSGDSELAQRILDDIKERESRGYTYELADGSLAILLHQHIGSYRPHFSLERFRLVVDDRASERSEAEGADSEATVKLYVGDTRHATIGESNSGPVDALDKALREALKDEYPEVERIELTDFKVRILDEKLGTGAITRVIIISSDGSESWGTIGVSDNIIEASWNALVDAVEYGLMKAGR